jgi:hypothetical protein
MTIVPWIHIKDRKPPLDEHVFVLFGAKDTDSEEHMGWREQNDCIVIGQWSTMYSEGDFLDEDHQIQFSQYWYPIFHDAKNVEVQPPRLIDIFKIQNKVIAEEILENELGENR